MLITLKLGSGGQDFEEHIRSIRLWLVCSFKVDLIYAAELARTTVNSWVEENSAHKITSIFPPGSIDNMTRMVLANTI